jgi:hypothetical protein
VDAFVALVQSGALERFRGEVSDSPVGLDDLATELKRATGTSASAPTGPAWGTQY